MNQYSDNFKNNLIKLCDNLCIIMEQNDLKTRNMEFIKSCLEQLDTKKIMLRFLKEFKSFFTNIINMDEIKFTEKLNEICHPYLTRKTISYILSEKYKKNEKLIVWNYIFKLYHIGLKYLITEEDQTLYTENEIISYSKLLDTKLKEIDILLS